MANRIINVSGVFTIQDVILNLVIFSTADLMSILSVKLTEIIDNIQQYLNILISQPPDLPFNTHNNVITFP